MKTLLFLTLLLTAVGAQAAEITIELPANCGSVGTNFKTAAACPCDLTSGVAGANKTDTQTDAGVTLSGTNCAGTIYFCVKADTTAGLDVTREDCINNVGLVARRTVASTGPGDYSATGGNALTGLTAQTGYDVGIFHVPTDFPNRPIFDREGPDFITDAGGGGGGGDLTGSVSVLDANSACVSGCNGATPALAWDTWSDVQNMAKGDDLAIMDDSVFDDTVISLTWDGEDPDRAIIGGAYIDTGDLNKLRWYNEGTGTGRGDKPEFNGTLHGSCLATRTCAAQGAGVPGNNNAGLMYIGGNFVSVQDIYLLGSAGVFIDVDGADCIIDRVDMKDAFFQLVRFVQGDGERCIIRNGVAEDWDWATNWGTGLNGQGGIMVRGHKDADGWGGIIQGMTFIDNGEDRFGSDNRSRTTSEVVNIVEATHAYVADNISYGIPNFYTDNAQFVVFERNVCIFPENSSGGTPSCFTSTIEEYPVGDGSNSFENDNALYRLNAAINADNGLVIRDNDDFVPANIDQQEIRFHANTVLNMWRLGIDWTVTDADADGPIFLTSNVLWSPNAQGVGGNWPHDNSCRMSNSQSILTDGYNAWDTGSLEAPCGDATDVYVSDLGLATDQTEWRTYHPVTNPFQWSDLKPTASSAILGDGQDSLSTDTISWLTLANFPQFTEMQVVGSCNDTIANWQKVVPCSADGTARPTTNTEPGAMQYP